MFDFKKKIKISLGCNTDINYLEEKEKRLEELKGMKERIIASLCEISEDVKYQQRNLINNLKSPFFPKNIKNYSEESKQHFKYLRELEHQFDNLIANTIDNILAQQSSYSNFLKSTMNSENVRIQYCKNKYPEASEIILLTRGKDINRCQLQIESALLNFYSSKEYIEVLQRYRTESLKR